MHVYLTDDLKVIDIYGSPEMYGGEKRYLVVRVAFEKDSSKDLWNVSAKYRSFLYDGVPYRGDYPLPEREELTPQQFETWLRAHGPAYSMGRCGTTLTKVPGSPWWEEKDIIDAERGSKMLLRDILAALEEPILE